jgi:Fe-S oxidoreductase
MKRKKANGLCCGAGGGRMFMEENLGKRINIERAQEVIASGAIKVTAACPYCITMLRDGLADLNGNVVVQDLAEIIDENTS